MAASVLPDQRDRAFGAGSLGLFGELDLIRRDIDRPPPDRDVALVVVREQVGSQPVAAAVARALVGIDEELHAPTSHSSGSSSGAVIAPPPRSLSTLSAASRESGNAPSHSSTAICISRRAR